MNEAGQESGRVVRRPKRRAAFVVIGVMVVGLAAVVLVAWYAACRIPAWYKPPGPNASADDAQIAESKLIVVQNWAASKHAFESAKSRGTKPLAQAPAEELTVAFTQDEVNSFLAKWYSSVGRQMIDGQQFSGIISSPMVVITPDHLTIAGKDPSLGDRVISLDIRPTVANEKLQLQLLRVRSGNLPLPEFTWKPTRTLLMDSLKAMLGKYQTSASFDKAGGAGPNAMAAVMALQGIDTLNGRPTLNVLFLPVISENAGLPVQLQSCELQDGMITLTTIPLDAEHRRQLLETIRKAKP